MGLNINITRLMFLMICSSFFKDVKSIPIPIKQARKVINVINDITTLVLGIDGMIDLLEQDKTDEEFQKNVTDKLDDLYQKMTNLDNGITDIKHIVDANTDQIILENALEEDKNYMLEIKRKLNIIESRYKQDFYNIYHQTKNYRHESIDGYISSIIDDDDLKDKLRDIEYATKLHDPQDYFVHKNVFQIAVSFLNNEKHYHRDCNSIPGYDKLFFFYNYLVKTVAKGYTMIIMAYQYRKMKYSDKTFYRQRQRDYQNFHKQAIVQITKSAKHYLNSINTINYKSSYACDLQPWEEEKNFIRVKNYVSSKTEELCSNVVPNKGVFRNPSDCDCIPRGHQVRSDLEYIISKPCVAPFLDSRSLYVNNYVPRYSEFKNNSNRFMVQICDRLFYNNALFENCVNDRNSDPVLSVRKVSLLPGFCHPDTNQVMTNARFYEKDGIIGIEAQCGIFVDGRVDSTSLKWNTYNREFYTRENHPYYRVLDWRIRSFNLDDVILPDGEFVTSIGFKIVDNHFLSLEVQGRKMYNNNCEVDIGETSFRYPVQDSRKPRQELIMNALPFAYSQTGQTYEMSQPSHFYVNVTASNKLYGAGLYLSLVPFFDMTEYIASPVLPLGGIGLMYKSVPGHSGFLAFKFISSICSHYISDDYVQKLYTKN